MSNQYIRHLNFITNCFKI